MNTIPVVLSILLCIGCFVINDICPCYIFEFALADEKHPHNYIILRVISRGFLKNNALNRSALAVENCIDEFTKVNKDSKYTYRLFNIIYLPRNVAFSASITEAINERDLLKQFE